MPKTLFFLSIFILFSCSKLPDASIKNSLENTLFESKDSIVLSSNNSTISKTLIFYPGGLVDPLSYLDWQDDLVSNIPSLRIVTVRMPSNLAVINSQKGELLFDEYLDTEQWIVAGHSLGGAMATNFVAKNQDKIDALIYLAAYPSDDRLKNFSNSILSIHAENDGLTTITDIEEHYGDLPIAYFMSSVTDFPSNLSNTTCYYLIEGGNHAQFGNYGEQDGDNQATISREQQQNEFVTLISNYIQSL
jgi:hypothetical protein